MVTKNANTSSAKNPADPSPSAARDVVLRFEKVSRLFGAFAAVQSIDLELQRGEVLTLLGPSGCGKTTTLRMAIGLERADEGRISYGDLTMDHPQGGVFIPPEQRQMGMVFQSYAIWPHMNVFENVAFPLRTRKVGESEVQSQVKAFLEIVGLAGFEQRSGMKLSGGQQQRVAVARGLVGAPDVLLMDEPFSNLDAKLRDQMRVELKELQKRLGTSILFVTHDQTEALALSDRIAVMKSGKVEQIGAPLDLYTHPQTPFVRDFLGQTLQIQADIHSITDDGSVQVALANGQILQVSGHSHLSAMRTSGPCLVTIRPEEIAIGEPSEQQAANHLAARIRTLLFLGQHYEALVDCEGGYQFLIHLPRLSSWQEGQAISIHLPSQFLQLWDRD